MTIQVELNPEIEARLLAEASARGVAVEEYARELLREALHLSPSRRGHLTPEEAQEMLRALGEGSEKLPVLPDSAFSRESLYEGR
jgi:hypothetical protein